jgi:hypothetical protein
MGKKSRFVQPEIVRLELSDGEWLEVKKRLTVGEERRIFGSMVQSVKQDGTSYMPNMDMIGKAELLAYIVEWSFKDAQDKPVKFSSDALDALTPEAYKEIEAAVDKHKAAVEEALGLEKKATTGSTELSTT